MPVRPLPVAARCTLLVHPRNLSHRRSPATPGTGTLSPASAERSLPVAWIGNQAGFERFQRERNRQLDAGLATLETVLPPAVKTMATLQRAMRAVIDDPPIQDVGDFCVPVV
jgi:hypothetical protein